MADNAADRKSVRAKEKASRQALAKRRLVVCELMSTPDGREYVYNRLEEAAVFSTVAISDPYQLAMFTGHRNAGIQLLNEITQFCPDLFILAMRESNGRNSDSRSDSDDRGTSEDGDSADLYVDPDDGTEVRNG